MITGVVYNSGPYSTRTYNRCIWQTGFCYAVAGYFRVENYITVTRQPEFYRQVTRKCDYLANAQLGFQLSANGVETLVALEPAR
jgi:hypothetical protein